MVHKIIKNKFYPQQAQQSIWNYDSDCSVGIIVMGPKQMSLKNIGSEIQEANKVWAFWTLFAGIAQYSVSKGVKTTQLAVARHVMKQPTRDEVLTDFHMYGEQAMDENGAPASITRFGYSRYNTRFMLGEIPNALDELATELTSQFDEIVPEMQNPNSTIRNNGIYLNHVVDGKVSMAIFTEESEIDPSKLQEAGRVTLEGDKLFYQPLGNHPKQDITEGLVKRS